jgi:tetratricopeptide (TPR) repeat protein
VNRRFLSNMQKGLALHQKGRLDKAAVLYRASLALRPNVSNALHLLGLVKFATVAANEALILIDRAAQSGMASPQMLLNCGLVLNALAVRFLSTHTIIAPFCLQRWAAPTRRWRAIEGCESHPTKRPCFLIAQIF